MNSIAYRLGYRAKLANLVSLPQDKAVEAVPSPDRALAAPVPPIKVIKQVVPQKTAFQTAK